MRIVIVEDEIRIREGLIRLCRRTGGHEVVGTAETGEAGLEMIERFRPDLVITDIRLPGMDGLQMLETLAGRDVPFKAVILSAYSEFAYAQRAIKLGVSEYLVKPVGLSEFSRALTAAEERLERERRSATLNPLQLRSIENVFYGMIQNGLKPDTELMEFLRQAYGIEDGRGFAAFGVYPGAEGTRREISTAADVKLRSTGIQYALLAFPRSGESVLVLYNLPDTERTKEYVVHAAVPAFISAAGRETVFSWRSFTNLVELPAAVGSVRNNLDWSITLGPGILIDTAHLPPIHPAPFAYPLELETCAMAAACAGDRPSLREHLGRFSDLLDSSQAAPEEIKEACTRLVLAVFNSLREAGGLSRHGFDLADVLGKISSAVTRRELFEAVRHLEQFPGEELPQQGRSLAVRRAEQLILDNYCRSITLNDLAAKLDLAPGYLGSLFHRETGLPFNSFLRDCRIRKAKELLIGTDRKLSSIAAAVGFSDPKYFSRVFRETTGMLPADFRRLHR